MTIEAELATTVGRSVVGLGRGARGGSGVVVGENRVLTLAHHLRGDDVEVVVADRGAQRARAVTVDALLDLALLDVDTGTVAAVRWGGSAAPEIGTPVHALADPGAGGLRVTSGAVSGGPVQVRGRNGRLVDGVLEHTAPLPPGSGGGPVVDGDGLVLGLNALRQAGGFILALPAAAVGPRLALLLAGTAASEPRRLGVAVLPAATARRLRLALGLEERDGLLVRATSDGSPADRAGLRRGDLIVGAGGRPVTSIDDLYAAIDATAADAALALVVLRAEREQELTVRFGAEDQR